MALLKDEVIVIKSLDFKEADKILTLFGRKTGKLAVIAKGIRRMTSKNRGNMQTLSISSISYYEGKSLGILRETELVSMPDFTKMDMNAVERVLVIINKMVPEKQPESEIYDKLKGLLMGGEFNMERINKFRFLILRELGLLPDSNRCIYTDDDDVKYIDKESLGMVSELAVKQGLVGKGKLLPIKSLKYDDPKLTESLDRYITIQIAA